MKKRKKESKKRKKTFGAETESAETPSAGLSGAKTQGAEKPQCGNTQCGNVAHRFYNSISSNKSAAGLLSRYLLGFNYTVVPIITDNRSAIVEKHHPKLSQGLQSCSLIKCQSQQSSNPQWLPVPSMTKPRHNKCIGMGINRRRSNK